MPEAVFNFIALLGWNPGGEDEIFSREELIKLFDEHRLSKSPAAFDQKKMDWMSNEYIKNADFDTILRWQNHSWKKAGRLTDKAEKLVELYKPQMKSVDEIVPLTDLFFEDFPELTDAEKEFMAGETVPTVLEAFKAKLEAMSDEDFKSENIFPQIKAVQKKQASKVKTSSCQSVSPFQVKCTAQNFQIPSTFLVVKNQSNTSITCLKACHNE